MIGFVLYAVLVWWFACLWRRRWAGALAVALGLFGCAAAAYLHWKLNVWTEGRIFLPVLQTLLYPYTALVGIVGLFVLALPRRVQAVAPCRTCTYEMAGLVPEVTECPECGAAWTPPKKEVPDPEELIQPEWAPAGAW